MRYILLSFFICSSFLYLQAQNYSADYQLIVDKADKTIVSTSLQAYEDLGVKATGTTALNNASDWIIDQYEDWGYTDIVKDNFTYGGQPHHNIVVTKVGTKYPSKYLVLSAHYDSINGKGANDNGTGTIALLEIARLLQDIDTEYSIKFIHFSAEEVGLVGSRHYVDNVAVPNNLDIRLVFNIDEVGGDAAKVNNTIVCERDESSPSSNNAASNEFTQQLATITRAYTSLNTTISYAYASDYMSFEDRGYVITGFFEANETPHRHKPTDLISNMDMDYYFEVVKAAVAATLHFANDESTPTPTPQAPKLLSFSPNDNTIDVAQNTTFTLNFDVPVQKAEGNILLYNYDSGQILQTLPASNTNVSNKQVSFQFANALPVGTNLYITIDNKAFKSADGAYYVGFGSRNVWNFSTLGITTAISQLQSGGKLEVYPNPIKRFLTVKVENAHSSKMSLEVLDIRSRNVLLQQEAKETITELDLERLEKGVYLLKVKVGKEIVTQKIVKQ